MAIVRVDDGEVVLEQVTKPASEISSEQVSALYIPRDALGDYDALAEILVHSPAYQKYLQQRAARPKCAWCQTRLSMLVSTARGALCPRCRAVADNLNEAWNKR